MLQPVRSMRSAIGDWVLPPFSGELLVLASSAVAALAVGDSESSWLVHEGDVKVAGESGASGVGAAGGGESQASRFASISVRTPSACACNRVAYNAALHTSPLGLGLRGWTAHSK